MQQWYYSCLLSIQKKRDCTVAVPHFEALVLPIIPNKQHRSPRRYVRIHARPLGTCDDRIYISRGHQNAAMCWNNVRIYQIPKCQAQSALETP